MLSKFLPSEWMKFRNKWVFLVSNKWVSLLQISSEIHPLHAPCPSSVHTLLDWFCTLSSRTEVEGLCHWSHILKGERRMRKSPLDHFHMCHTLSYTSQPLGGVVAPLFSWWGNNWGQEGWWTYCYSPSVKAPLLSLRNYLPLPWSMRLGWNWHRLNQSEHLNHLISDWFRDEHVIQT